MTGRYKKPIAFLIVFMMILSANIGSYATIIERVGGPGDTASLEELEVSPTSDLLEDEDEEILEDEKEPEGEELAEGELLEYSIEYLIKDTGEAVPGLDVFLGEGQLDELIEINHPELEGYKLLEEQPTNFILNENPELNKKVIYYLQDLIEENTILTVNHFLLLENGEEELIESEEITGLLIGETVYGNEFELNNDNEFLFSQPEQLELKEEDNVLNLFYEEGFDMGDNPDGLSRPEYIDAPYIEEYAPGSLGPFSNEMFGRMMRAIQTLAHPGDHNNIEPPAAGSLDIDKWASPTANPNQWRIDLTLTGKDIPTTSDIVLVIDRSGSMDGTRMTSAKAAAKDFVNTLLADSSKIGTRIAVVSFAGNVTTDSGFKDYSGKSDLISAINGLTASGGTFIQAGIGQASSLLNASSANKKSIVLLGDGAATYSYEIKNPNNHLEYWKRQSSRDYYRTTTAVPESQFKYDSTVGSGSSDTTRYENTSSYRRYYRHGASSIAEASFAKAKGYHMYTVALDAGIEGDWTLDGIANPGNAYTGSPSDLNQIFQTIAGSLSYAATNVTITDPMGPMFSIPGINSSNYLQKITVNRGTLSWNNATKTISWHLNTISEGNPATMSYLVEIDNTAASGQVYPTNGHTYVDYKNALDNNARKTFPEPEAGINAGTIKIHYYRVDPTGQPINSSGQPITKEQAELQVLTYPTSPLSFNTPYTVTGPATVTIGTTDYQYNGTGNVGNPNPETITLTAANPSAHVWFAYEEVTDVTVTYTTDGNGSITGETPQTIAYGGSTTQVTATPNPGYYFVKWDDDNTNATRNEMDVRVDATYTANFEKDTSKWHTVKFVAGSNGNLKAGDQTEFNNILDGTAWGTAVTVPTPEASPGYNFKDWTPTFPATVTESATYTANFETVNQTLVYDSNGGTGTMSDRIEPTDKEFDLDENLFTRDGFTFVGWNKAAIGNAVEYVDKASFKMPATGSKLYAMWAGLEVSKVGTYVETEETVKVGDTINYEITVKNTGNVTLTNVVVTDLKITLSVPTGDTNGNSKLDVGETWIYTGNYEITQADIDLGKVLNTVLVDTDETEPKEETEETPLEKSPGLKVVKEGIYVDFNEDEKVNVGDRIDYTIIVTNTGNTTLTNVVVKDPMLGLEVTVDKIEVGGTWTYNGSYSITQADIDKGLVINKVTVDTDETEPEEETEETPLDKSPGMEVVKEGIYVDFNEDEKVNLGDRIDYTIRVTNTGNTTLTNVVVKDPMLGLEVTVDKIEVGGTWTYNGSYSITQADIDKGLVINKVTVDTDETDPKEETEETPLTQSPSLTISKTANKSKFNSVGEVVTYTITVTNTGNITLTGISVTDPLIELKGPVGDENENNKLDIGEVWIYTGDYTITAEDMAKGTVTNLATVETEETEPTTDSITIGKNSASYIVRYLESGTNRQLRPEKNGSGIIGTNITESAISIGGYSALAPTTVTIELQPSGNVITFLYRERTTPVDPGPTDPAPFVPVEEEIIDEPIPQALPELNREDHFQYIQGYPDNTVRPEGLITREEVAAVFFRLLTEGYRNTVRTLDHNFPDVENNRWSTKHIATLARGGIIEGYEDGSFRPGNFITRAELATIASRFDNLSPFEKNSFSDISGHWANKYINSASAKGWVNGYPDGTFKPNQYITRAEFVTLVNNVLDRRVHKKDILPESRKFPDLLETKWYYEAMQESINSHHYNRMENTYEDWIDIYYPMPEM